QQRRVLERRGFEQFDGRFTQGRSGDRAVVFLKFAQGLLEAGKADRLGARLRRTARRTRRRTTHQREAGQKKGADGGQCDKSARTVIHGSWLGSVFVGTGSWLERSVGTRWKKETRIAISEPAKASHPKRSPMLAYIVRLGSVS